MAAQGQASVPSCAQWAPEGLLPGGSFRWFWGRWEGGGGVILDFWPSWWGWEKGQETILIEIEKLTDYRRVLNPLLSGKLLEARH